MLIWKKYAQSENFHVKKLSKKVKKFQITYNKLKHFNANK